MNHHEPLRECTAVIVAAYLAKNPLPAQELPSFIESVHAALEGACSAGADPGGGWSVPAPEREPAVDLAASVNDAYLICLECGSQQQRLTKHLNSQHDLSPDAYRERWGLPADYPMVALFSALLSQVPRGKRAMQ